MRTLRIAVITTVALAAVALGQLQQQQDEDFAKSVKEWTTRPEFLSPLVDHLPKVSGVPSPKDVLGYHAGAPKKLSRVADIGKYYRALAAASKRVKLLPAGTTDEGRECMVIAVADEETIRNLDTYKGYLARLADPRGLAPAEAQRIIGLAKPVYMFMGGLHSAETGPPEMLMELAYRIAVEDSPLYDSIRRNVIVMLTAVAEPDGRDRYVDWYYRNNVNVENEQDRVAGPPYWGKYTYHDNNRDINYSQMTMRNWLKFYLEWHPPIMHDLHESQPLLYTFSGQSPQNPNLDPILYAEMPLFANYEVAKMTSYGMPGVWTHAFVDMWAPGYLGFMASNHNGMMRMYETFGNGGPTTTRRNLAGGGRGGAEAAPGGGEAPSPDASAAGGEASGAAGGRGGRGAAGGETSGAAGGSGGRGAAGGETSGAAGGRGARGGAGGGDTAGAAGGPGGRGAAGGETAAQAGGRGARGGAATGETPAAETAGRGGAAAAAGRGGGRGATAREWYRPLPPPSTVMWSMRNNTNYMETGVLAALEFTSTFSKTVLENFYKKSANSVKSGETEAPFGYVLPVQPEMTRVANLVNILRLQGIEVGRASAPFQIGQTSYPAGSVVIKRNQPYGRLAKTLMEKQNFPEGNLTTYDDTGWTMGLMSHAKVDEIADKAILDVKVEPIGTMTVPGAVKGSARLTAVIQNGANALITLRYRLKDVKFEAIERAAKAGDVDLPAGTLLVDSSPRVTAEIEKLGLQAVTLDQAPAVSRHLVEAPRVAMFSIWGSTQDIGWARYAFDQYEVAYDLIYKERIAKGNLRADYDVIVIPSMGRTSGKALLFDIEPRPGAKPVAYNKTAEFPTLGMYGESEDIRGGIGLAGLAEFDKFVNTGGTLITLGASSAMPADMGIVRTVEATRTTAQFYAPGPIVEAEILNQNHPIFYGYTNRVVPVRWANGPLLRVTSTDDRASVLMQFTGTDRAVLSGLMRGVAETRARPAVVQQAVGQGSVVMFATNPAYRWQNFGEWGMLANSILNFNDFPKIERRAAPAAQ